MKSTFERTIGSGRRAKPIRFLVFLLDRVLDMNYAVMLMDTDFKKGFYIRIDLHGPWKDKWGKNSNWMGFMHLRVKTLKDVHKTIRASNRNFPVDTDGYEITEGLLSNYHGAYERFSSPPEA